MEIDEAKERSTIGGRCSIERDSWIGDMFWYWEGCWWGSGRWSIECNWSWAGSEYGSWRWVFENSWAWLGLGDGSGYYDGTGYGGGYDDDD